MTEVASRAPQGQSIIDTISRPGSSKQGAQAHRGSSKPSRMAQDADAPNDQGRDRSVDNASSRERRADPKSVDTTAKVSEKPRRENDTDDDAQTSFEATIDTLGSQESQSPAPQAASINPQAWNTMPAFGSVPEQTANDGSESSATNVKAASIPGHILKQASVVALLEAKQRLMAAQDTTPMAESTTEETVTTPLSVQSREAHWIFDTNSGSRSQNIESLTSKANAENPLSALSAATTAKSDDGVAKLSTDTTLAAQGAEQRPAADAAPQQNFSGTQDGKSGSREQSGKMDAGPRSILDASSSAPVEKIVQDSPEAPPTLSAATQQVRSGVLTALADDRAGAETFSPRQVADRPPVAVYVLRSIDLTLSPPDLGTVRLKLSLKASALDIDAETSKAATAKLLDDDRKGLEQSLRDAGYDVKSLKISDISSSSNSSLNSSLNNGGSSFQDGSQARANLNGREDEGAPRRDGDMPGQSQQRRRDDSQPSSGAEVTSGRQSNAIYI